MRSNVLLFIGLLSRIAPGPYQRWSVDWRLPQALCWWSLGHAGSQVKAVVRRTHCCVTDLKIVVLQVSLWQLDSFRKQTTEVLTMLFEQLESLSRLRDTVRWQREVNAESAERNGIRDTDGYLGFAGDDDLHVVGSVSIRTKILHTQQGTRPHSLFL
jgi:hypothetical protein